MENKDYYEGKASRNKIPYRYDLIPKAGLDLIAARFYLGVQSHGENNWRSGGEEFLKSSLNHAISHLLDYLKNGNNVEVQGPGGNLGAVGWFVACAAEFENKNIKWLGNQRFNETKEERHSKIPQKSLDSVVKISKKKCC